MMAAVMAVQARVAGKGVDGPELDGPEIFLKEIAKKYQWNLDSFQTHQQVTQ